ncbi:MAG: sugar ABC transporter permease [Actinomycetaceae bacterium]|nr:sugar ABC transporter permease [Actinomycetaceae bacterium]MDU0971240.1 sugar ABC transporter permease [Actinomycetaceae bacterium]
MVLFNYYPFFDTIKISTQSTDLFGRPNGFIGFGNYADMFASDDFWQVMLRTVIFVVLTVSMKLILGLAIALPLSSGLAGTRLVRPIVLIPMAFSAAVASVVFKTMFAPRVGLFDQFLRTLGLPTPPWLTSGGWAMVAILITIAWTSMGMVIMLFMAALDSVPREVLEAASLDGVNLWQRIVHMQLPLISPTIFFLVVTETMGALKEFTIIQVLTNGGPNNATTTLTIQLYKLAFGSNVDYGTSAAHGIILMIIVGIVAFFQFRMGEKKVVY